MKLMRLRLKKNELNRLDPYEQAFLIHIGWFLTETMILKKLLVISGNLKSKTGITATGARVQNLFFLRSLAGKLYEGCNS